MLHFPYIIESFSKKIEKTGFIFIIKRISDHYFFHLMGNILISRWNNWSSSEGVYYLINFYFSIIWKVRLTSQAVCQTNDRNTNVWDRIPISSVPCNLLYCSYLFCDALLKCIKCFRQGSPETVLSNDLKSSVSGLFIDVSVYSGYVHDFWCFPVRIQCLSSNCKQKK